jgi:hypothetical protein
LIFFIGPLLSKIPSPVYALSSSGALFRPAADAEMRCTMGMPDARNSPCWISFLLSFITF